MPFVYELKLASQVTEHTFVQQLAPAGSLVGTGQAIATLTNGREEVHVQAPRQGLLVAWFAQAGTEVQGGNVLARIVCEGDTVKVDDAVPVRLG